MPERLTLYFSTESIPSQSCLILVNLLNCDIDLESVDVIHNAPVLVHGEMVLTESRSILAYLVDLFKYGDSLYPSNLKQRAIINQRLFYDAAIVYPSVVEIMRHKNEIPQKSKDAFLAVVRVLEGLLANSIYFASNKNTTISDLSILPSLTFALELGLNLSNFPMLNEWYERMKTVPGFDENLLSAKLVAKTVKDNVGDVIF